MSGWRGACGRGQGWVWGRLEVSPKLSLLAHATLLVWGRRGGSRPGHPPGVFSRIFPPVLKRCRAGGCRWCSAGWCWLGMEQPGWFRGTDGRTEGQTCCCSPSASRVSPAAASLPRIHPAGARLFPASLCVLWRDQSVPAVLGCPQPSLSPAPHPAGVGCALWGAAGWFPGPGVWILNVLGCENPVDFPPIPGVQRGCWCV